MRRSDHGEMARANPRRPSLKLGGGDGFHSKLQEALVMAKEVKGQEDALDIALSHGCICSLKRVDEDRARRGCHVTRGVHRWLAHCQDGKGIALKRN